MASASIRTKSLYTLGELIRGHGENLNAFAAMTLLNISFRLGFSGIIIDIAYEASKQTQPLLMRLVLVLLNSKDLGERIAALHAFQCYLAGNEEGQTALASTVTPPSMAEEGPETAPQSIGGYLLRALLGWVNTPTPDTVSSWLAACVVSKFLLSCNYWNYFFIVRSFPRS